MRILGLDIGTTSIGFALIDLDKSRAAGSILRLGVRIFPEARDPDGTPLNQQRRAKRMMRRQLRRRRDRRRSLNELLASSDLLPSYGGNQWREVMKLDPYALRAKGLSKRLTPHELGRALYHLSKRRHFKERDLAEIGESESVPEAEEGALAKPRGKAKAAPKDGESNDEAKSTEARKHLVAELKASGQTLGQALAARAPDAKRRGEHATRAIVEEEFFRLVAAQAPHHTVLRDAAFHGAVEEAIFAQRPVFWRKSTLGKCALMPGEPLCPKGSWLSQERRMLEKVNNLAIVGGNARPLDKEERGAILAALRIQKTLSWPGMRRLLEPSFKARGESTKTLHFNLEAGDEKGGLKGNIVEADLAKIFGASWNSHPHKHELRNFVPESLWQADYGEIGTQRVVIRREKDRASRRKVLAQRLVDDFGASAEQAEAIVKLHFPQGWEPYSTKALRDLLPQLEQGHRFGALIAGPDFAKWRDENFPERDQSTGEVIDRLPSPRGDRNATHAQREEAVRIASVRNPTVVRVQNEMRKIVNNLIALYDKPDMIRVELARDVGTSKREREEISKGMRKKEGMRKKARDDLNENGRTNPSDADVEKWLLWQECGRQCPYTGDPIGFDDVFSGNPRFDIEHIWPKPISLDNSFRNKTLCRKDINLAKGNRIPYEFFQSRPEDWQAAKDRIWKMVAKDGMNAGKARRFCAESMPDDFVSRQLNDTGYAARQVSEVLKRLWPDIGPTAKVHVQPVTGKVTALLRRRWQLNHILGEDGEKTRADHRHHAIDALVVACADGGYTQKLSRYFEAESDYQRGRGAKPSDAIVDPPWANIRADVERAVAGIVVSHRVRKKVSGPLHLETVYGDTGIDEKTKRESYRLFVIRKPVEHLSKNEVEDIVDDHVRWVVTEWVASHGGDPKKAFATFPRVSESGPEIRKVRLHRRQQLALMAPVSTGFADMSNNHHIAIYTNSAGDPNFEVVPLFEASKRLRDGKNGVVVHRDMEDRRFVMSLSPGDMIEIPDGERKGMWVVRKLSGNGQVFFKKNSDATPAREGLWGPNPGSLLAMKARKVSIDPIGRIRAAND
jgi:CRISPR-associated endonuclease Csn1